jgi:hypothetical protein
MDPYVLALQLYLFNKACGGLPLRIAEQIVVTGVINTACWTARAIGTGVMWVVTPSTRNNQQSKTNQCEPVSNITTNPVNSPTINTYLESNNEFEIITQEQILELETEIENSKNVVNKT